MKQNCYFWRFRLIFAATELVECFSMTSSTMLGVGESHAFIWKFAKEIRLLSCIGRPVSPWPGAAANITGEDSAANLTHLHLAAIFNYS